MSDLQVNRRDESGHYISPELVNVDPAHMYDSYDVLAYMKEVIARGYLAGNKKMKVILISGKAEAGKTTTAGFIKNYLLRHKILPVLIPYGNYVKTTAKELLEWNGQKDQQGRELLQWWGTDYVRYKEPTFWVDTVIRMAKVLKDVCHYLIIDDARFVDEITLWNTCDFAEVITIRVERPGHENALTDAQRNHISETSLDNYIFDAVLSATNKTDLIDEMYEKVVPLLDVR